MSTTKKSNTKNAKGEGVALGCLAGWGMASIFIVIGILLSLTGVGAIIGIPLIIGGFFMPFLGPLIGLANIKGDCPYCGNVVTAMSTKPGIDCPACKKRIIIKDKNFYRSDRGTSSDTKKCPYCAEEIQIEAIKCKHCGEILDKPISKSEEAPQEKETPELEKKEPKHVSRKKIDWKMGCLLIFTTLMAILVIISICINPAPPTKQAKQKVQQQSSITIWQSLLEDIESEAVRKLVAQQAINIKDSGRLLVEAKAHLENNQLEAANILLYQILKKSPVSPEAIAANKILANILEEHPNWIEASKKKRADNAAQVQKQEQEQKQLKQKERQQQQATTVLSSKQWFKGGNLHKATVAQWKRATYQNKLATAADWLVVTKWKGYLNSPADFDKIKVKAKMLVDAVDTVVTVKNTESLQVTEIALTIINMSDDLGP